MARRAQVGAGVLVLLACATRAAAVGTREPVQVRVPSRGGTVVVKVRDYDQARQAVLSAALQHGAELLNSRTEADYQGKQHGWMRFRLAADRLPLLLAGTRSVGRPYAENFTAADHTSEYEELERRIGRLREHQPRLESILQSNRRLRGSDILFVQERLFRAGVDEGMLRQRRADLERNARTATLVVELFEPETRRALDLGNYYAAASLRARGAMYRWLARAMTVGAFALTFAPFWIPALIVGLLLLRWLLRCGRALLVRLAPLGAQLAGFISPYLPARLERAERFGPSP
jgi:hypothetical protein